MVSKRSWQEFRESGLFWWVNSLLHTFGWAIVVEVEENEVVNVYPARTKFRGFDVKTNDDGFRKVTQYMKDNAEELLKECE